MADPRRRRRVSIERSDLPDTFTVETLRDIDFATLRQLARPGNGVLSPEEQSDFDAALRTVMAEARGRLDRATHRGGRPPRGAWDPELADSYDRTRRYLAEHARRGLDHLLEVEATPPTAESNGVAPEADGDGTIADLESDIEQASTTLELLERIASIEEQQLDHHRVQERRDTRGLFFGTLVSIAVIVAGITPLVEATPHQRTAILLWTLATCVAAGIVYAAVRAVQSLRARKGDTDADQT